MKTRWLGRLGMAACVDGMRTAFAVVRGGRLKIPRTHAEESIVEALCALVVVVASKDLGVLSWLLPNICCRSGFARKHP